MQVVGHSLYSNTSKLKADAKSQTYIHIGGLYQCNVQALDECTPDGL